MKKLKNKIISKLLRLAFNTIFKNTTVIYAPKGREIEMKLYSPIRVENSTALINNVRIWSDMNSKYRGTFIFNDKKVL